MLLFMLMATPAMIEEELRSQIKRSEHKTSPPLAHDTACTRVARRRLQHDLRWASQRVRGE